MFDFHEKRKLRPYLYSPVVLFILLAGVAVISASVYERFSVEREMAARRDAAQAQLRLLQERAALLDQKVERLENERGIEQEIRRRFNVAKEGEQVVVILKEQEPPAAGRTTPPLQAASQEAWQPLLSWLLWWR